LEIAELALAPEADPLAYAEVPVNHALADIAAGVIGTFIDAYNEGLEGILKKAFTTQANQDGPAPVPNAAEALHDQSTLGLNQSGEDAERAAGFSP
jgi:hypothetical protein